MVQTYVSTIKHHFPGLFFLETKPIDVDLLGVKACWVTLHSSYLGRFPLAGSSDLVM